jgi:hypothetical protein
MAYIINKTDGSILTTLIDGTLDETTDLTLIGKNYLGFGEVFNENLVKLLENFASISPPDRPITGQLWYDISEGRMKVFTINGWKASGGPIVSESQPLTLTTGDLWIDNSENQMWMYDGTDLILVGPIWKKSQGKTGFTAETLTDVNGNTKSVLNLYVSDFLLGIFSSDNFTPSPTITGFTDLVRGFNANSQVNFIFDTIVSKAQGLVDGSGNSITHSQFVRSDQNSTTSGKLLIQTNQGLTIGQNQNIDLKVTGNAFIVENTIIDGDIALRTKNVTSLNTGLYIDASTNCVGIFTSTPQLLLNSSNVPTQTLDVDGILRVRGDLIVEGDTTTINVSNLSIEDKAIEIAKTASPSDSYANDAGIIIKGDSDKKITWTQATEAFDVTENVNLGLGKVIRINNVEVLSLTSLGPTITSAPGITTFGPQTEITVDDLYINNNRISSTASNTDIEFDPAGTGNIALIGNPRITGMANPVSPTDAATKTYVDTIAASQPISLTIVENGIQNAIDSNIVLILNDIASPTYFSDGKTAFVHCQYLDYDSTAITATRTLKKFEIQSGVWVFVSNLSSSV